MFVSDHVQALLGHDQLNLVGRSVRSMVHKEDIDTVAGQFATQAGGFWLLFPEKMFSNYQSSVQIVQNLNNVSLLNNLT